MDKLREARAALARQIKNKPVTNRLAALAEVERNEKPSPTKWRPVPNTAQQVKDEILQGLLDNMKRHQILGTQKTQDTLGGVYGSRGEVIWVDDAADDAKYAGKVKIVDPDRYAGIGRRINLDDPGPPAPPKLDNAWFGNYSQSIVPPPPKPPAPDPTAVEKVAAVVAADHEYEQFKVWLYKMIADAQDDLSPAFAYSVAKVKFQPLRAAVQKVVKVNALFMMASNRKGRLVDFQKWIDGVKPDDPWQVTGKELLVRMVRVIDPYAT